MNMNSVNFINPYRREVLGWYRKMLKAAFEVPWETDTDAVYVLEETRKLFRANKDIAEVARVQIKLQEAEMRYSLACHYRIPYARMYNKTMGNSPDSLGAYSVYLDSHYDYNGCAPHPAMVGQQARESAAGVVMGSGGGGVEDTPFREDKTE